MHVVVWGNKPDLDSMSMDDLYNNLKVYEPKVKRVSSSSSNTQNMAFVSSLNSNSSTEGVNIAFGVTTAGTRVNAANLTNIDNLSDAVIYAFLASQPNTIETLKSNNEQLLKDLKKSELNVLAYKEGLKSVEARLEFFKTNETIYLEDTKGNPQKALKDKGVIDSRCSRHMTGNMSYLSYFKELNGGYVAFGGNLKGGKITCKGNMSYLTDYEEINGGYVSFGGNPKRGKIIGKGKFDGKADEEFFVGYSLNSKAFRVFNNRTRIVEENLHVRFSENSHNSVGSGPKWLFDIDVLTKTMNNEPLVLQSNDFSGINARNNAGEARKEKTPCKDYILLPLWTVDPTIKMGMGCLP
nr:ribonuclease H-like domain-containing protein [Tanacetum cinerariifolium]